MGNDNDVSKEIDSQVKKDEELKEIDALIEAIQTPVIKEQKNSSTDETVLTEECLNEYILQKAKSLIEAGVSAIESLKPYILQSQIPDEIAALAELVNSTTRSIEILNKINLQNKKAITDEKMKRIEIEARKEIALKLPNISSNTTNVVIASREEILQKLFGQRINQDQNVIDVSPTEEGVLAEKRVTPEDEKS